jgi:hypothetical protein
MKPHESTTKFYRITIAAVLMFLAIVLSSCTQPDQAAKVLENAGFICGEDDNFAISLNTVGPTGRPMSGAVCSGFSKGATIRLR